MVRAPNSEFLLVQYTYIPESHFPGGGVEVEQAVVEATLANELLQETGLCVSRAAQLHGIFISF